MMIRLVIGFLSSAFVAFVAFKKKSLTLSGLIGAVVLGTLVYGFGDSNFYLWMMLFFFSSLGIRKTSILLIPTITNKKKHEPRNWIQVIANGGLLGLLSVLYASYPTDWVFFACALAMAAATADTWASELGTLSTIQPVTLLGRKPIVVGLSGGVTRLGLWASLTGSALISVSYGLALIQRHELNSTVFLMTILCLAGGFTGSLIDSLLGEFVQAKYQTDSAEISEISNHHHNTLIHGIAWVDNNLVNLFSNILTVTGFNLLLWILGWLK